MISKQQVTNTHQNETQSKLTAAFYSVEGVIDGHIRTQSAQPVDKPIEIPVNDIGEVYKQHLDRQTLSLLGFITYIIRQYEKVGWTGEYDQDKGMLLLF